MLVLLCPLFHYTLCCCEKKYVILSGGYWDGWWISHTNTGLHPCRPLCVSLVELSLTRFTFALRTQVAVLSFMTLSWCRGLFSESVHPALHPSPGDFQQPLSGVCYLTVILRLLHSDSLRLCVSLFLSSCPLIQSSIHQSAPLQTRGLLLTATANLLTVSIIIYTLYLVSVPCPSILLLFSTFLSFSVYLFSIHPLPPLCIYHYDLIRMDLYQKHVSPREDSPHIFGLSQLLTPRHLMFILSSWVCNLFPMLPISQK